MKIEIDRNDPAEISAEDVEVGQVYYHKDHPSHRYMRISSHGNSVSNTDSVPCVDLEDGTVNFTNYDSMVVVDHNAVLKAG